MLIETRQYWHSGGVYAGSGVFSLSADLVGGGFLIERQYQSVDRCAGIVYNVPQNTMRYHHERFARMPTYVYACNACSTQFEQFQSFKDEPLQECPSCAGVVRRVFQPVGIVFKGSGWYITDSRKATSATVSNDDSASKSEKPAAGESSSTSDTTTDTKSSDASKSTTDTKSNGANKPTTE